MAQQRGPRMMFDSYGEVISVESVDPELNKQPNFGLLFDIDGVLGRGAHAFPQAQEAFKLLCNPAGTELQVPVAFVTNACGDPDAKCKLLSKWFNTQIHVDQLIQAPSPLKVFKSHHQKRVLFIGQDHVLDIAHDLGFINAVTLDDVKAAYPLLDMVDHSNRRRIAKWIPEPRPLDRIEMVILIGEPKRWESNLQLLVDVIATNGKPDHNPVSFGEDHLPVIACNMDYVYMDQSPLPRFGHGSFLLCLESIYQKITGQTLNYTSVLGKPSEITYRFAEHTISLISKRLGYHRAIDRLYFFGDNPFVDILGSNLYNNFLRRFRRRSGGETAEQITERSVSVAHSRAIPADAELLPQTARGIDSILVTTGVYTPGVSMRNYCHRDFQGAKDLALPTYEVLDCIEGVRLVLDHQNFHPSIQLEENEA